MNAIELIESTIREVKSRLKAADIRVVDRSARDGMKFFTLIASLPTNDDAQIWIDLNTFTPLHGSEPAVRFVCSGMASRNRVTLSPRKGRVYPLDSFVNQIKGWLETKIVSDKLRIEAEKRRGELEALADKEVPIPSDHAFDGAFCRSRKDDGTYEVRVWLSRCPQAAVLQLQEIAYSNGPITPQVQRSKPLRKP